MEEVVDMELYNNLLEKYNELSKENHELKHRLSNLEQLIIKMIKLIRWNMQGI